MNLTNRKSTTATAIREGSVSPLLFNHEPGELAVVTRCSTCEGLDSATVLTHWKGHIHSLGEGNVLLCEQVREQAWCKCRRFG